MKQMLKTMAFALLLVPALLLADQVQVPDGTTVPIELKNYLSAKKAKVGDAVKMEITRDVLGKDKEKLIPRGAKVMGKVTRVVAGGKDAESVISIVADRAEWKGGSAELHALIAGAVRPPEINTELLASNNARGSGGNTNPSRGTPDSGGAGQQDSVRSAVEESMSNQTGEVQAGKPDEFRKFRAALTSGAQGSYIEGVQLRMSSDANVVTELASKKNIELESGVTLTLRQFSGQAPAQK
jgi:hypothetical protein